MHEELICAFHPTPQAADRPRHQNVFLPVNPSVSSLRAPPPHPTSPLVFSLTPFISLRLLLGMAAAEPTREHTYAETHTHRLADAELSALTLTRAEDEL